MEETTSKIQRRGTARQDFQETYLKLTAFIQVPLPARSSSTTRS
jgi:hypothetical protein